MTGPDISKLLNSHAGERDDPQWTARLRVFVSDIEATPPVTLMPVFAECANEAENFALRATMAMFSLNPTIDAGIDFGTAAKLIRSKISPDGDPHGVNKRFREILDGDADDMLVHNLLWFARMGKKHDVWFGWAALFDGLAAWDAEEKPTQRQWSRSFWGSRETREEHTK